MILCARRRSNQSGKDFRLLVSEIPTLTALAHVRHNRDRRPRSAVCLPTGDKLITIDSISVVLRAIAFPTSGAASASAVRAAAWFHQSLPPARRRKTAMRGHSHFQRKTHRRSRLLNRCLARTSLVTAQRRWSREHRDRHIRQRFHCAAEPGNRNGREDSCTLSRTLASGTAHVHRIDECIAITRMRAMHAPAKPIFPSWLRTDDLPAS